MTTGSTLYLIMCLATFGLFSVVLGYYSWQESTPGQESGVSAGTASGTARHPRGVSPRPRSA